MSLDFVAFDVETANASRGSICAMGFATVRDGQIVHRESWLTKPPEGLDWFDGFNISIHGITPAMVRDARSFEESWELAQGIFGALPVVAHNAGFDMGAIRESCDAIGAEWPSLDYACTMVLTRPLVQLPSYSLPFVCDALGIAFEHHHDAEADAVAAAQVALTLAERTGADSLEALADAAGVRLGQLRPVEWLGCHRVRDRSGSGNPWAYPAPPPANTQANPDHPFYGQVIVFTGALSMRRVDAWAAVSELGATPEDSVTKRTSILVVGDGFTGHFAADFTTGKAAKATKWLAKGHAIEIMNEQDFMQTLGDSGSQLSREELDT